MAKTLNVLHIATLNRPIRKSLGYGPIEAVIYNIDKGLTGLGQNSIVACSGDSDVFGKKFTTIEKSFTEYWSNDTGLQRQNMQKHLDLSLKRALKGDIDIIHMHDSIMVDFVYRGICKSPVPVVMTLHVPVAEKLAFDRWKESFNSNSKVYFVPISRYQQNQHAGLTNIQDVIHHGIDIEDYPFNKKSDNADYLFSIGRITRDKGQDKAVEVARKSGSRLVIAGNVQNKPDDRTFFSELKKSIDFITSGNSVHTGNDYYENVMKPLLDSENQIIYIGELDSEQKKLWYQYARATLFPIQWGEPFGLVLIESMACGTPVLAFNKGSVPEIVVHGKTGYVVGTLDEMVKVVKKIDMIDPLECRNHIKKTFSLSGMASKYFDLYQRILELN